MANIGANGASHRQLHHTNIHTEPHTNTLSPHSVHLITVHPSFKHGTGKALTKAVACKCEICHCGQHKCPELPAAASHYDANDLKSTYAGHFPVHTCGQVNYVKAPAQSIHVDQSIKFADKTSNQLDYGGVKGKPSTPFRPNQDYTNPIVDSTSADDRDFSTGNSAYFSTAAGYNARESFKPKGNTLALEKTPFEGTSVSQSDFNHKHGAKPSTPFKPQSDAMAHTAETRDFQSHTQAIHSGMMGERAQAFKPAPQVLRAGGAFDATTTHADTYKLNAGAKPATPFIPARSNTVDGNADTRDFSTTSKHGAGHNGTGVHVRESFKPKQPLHVTGNVPLDATTSHQSDYGLKQGKPSTPFRPNWQGTTDVTGAIGGADGRDWGTENSQYFSNTTSRPAESFKPRGSELTSEKFAFDGQSHSQDTYRQYNGAKPSTPFKPVSDALVNNSEDRDFKSHTQAIHSGMMGERAQAFKPAPQVLRAGATFEGTTTHQDAFVKHESQKCPAANLHHDTERGADGHLRYEKTHNNQWASTKSNGLPIVQ